MHARRKIVFNGQCRDEGVAGWGRRNDALGTRRRQSLWIGLVVYKVGGCYHDQTQRIAEMVAK